MTNNAAELRDYIQACAELRKKIMLAQDAIDRACDNLAGAELPAKQCGYIDGQLARAISYLASARAVVITAGSLTNPAYDDGDVWDMDDVVEIADVLGDEYGKGGGA